MNSKTLVAGVLGGIVYFLLGWLLYGILLASTFKGLAGSAQGVDRGENVVLWSLLLGNIFLGLLMAYILNHWAKISTVQTGAIAATTVGFLLSLGMDLIYYATSNMMQLGGIFLDVFVMTVMSAAAGAVIGWWLGRS